ncbi:MAG: VanZ family protein [Mogibacterium sp.]|nr:VanZ family protein [Mogibacterium sp.]
MLIAYFMVILPLPDRASTVGNTLQDHLNLIPFRQIWLYWHDRAVNLPAILAYMKSMALWQLLFNILLTVPFGVYMHYYFNKSLKRTILLSFLLSLFYELSQLTALFGIYPGPYRLADVEDDSIYSMAYRWSFFCVFSLLQVLLTKGYTLGHAICRMILVSKDGSAATSSQLLKRYFCLWLFTGFPIIIAGWFENGQYGSVKDYVIILLFVASRIYFVIYFMKEAVLRGERPMTHDKLSGTVYMAAEIPEKSPVE